MAKVVDMTGQTFGRLTVIERAPAPVYYGGNGKYAWWRCRCECGTVFDVRGSSLRDGFTKSCGCLRSETMRKLQQQRHEARRRARDAK